MSEFDVGVKRDAAKGMGRIISRLGKLEAQFETPRLSAEAQSWSTAVSSLLMFPGLRGLWPMSPVDASGNTLDVSGNGRTLTYNGNPVYNNDGLAPYIDLDGTGDFLSRADEAGLDILGTESYIASPGLTLGGWFWTDDGENGDRFMAKGLTSGNDRSYHLFITGGVFRFLISADGASVSGVGSTAVTTGEWVFLAGRFIPSTEAAIWANDVKETITSSIPASIFNSSGGLGIGAQADGSNPLDGRACLCFLCASAVPDEFIENYYELTRPLFG